jgi:predicted metal-dependent phosphoesterase TrpH
MLIDMHIHTKRGSSCSVLHTKDLVKEAVALHLDAVCITDHNTTKVVDRVKKAGKEYGLLVLGGIEVRCLEGDVLAFGLEQSPRPRIQARELLKLVQSIGGATVVAHPFRTSAPSLLKKVYEITGFDALEILNGNSSPDENWKAEQAAKRLGLPGTG